MSWSQNRSIPDFIIYIDKKTYRCYASVISSFSPFIRHIINNNQNWYYFENLKDPNGDFEQFLKLINGFEIDISMSNAAFLNEISKVLQIQSLFKATESFLNSISRTPENLLNLFESYVSHQIPCPELVKEIISKWDNIETLIDIPNEGLLSLSVSSLEYLFSSDTFQQNKEDTLFDLIIKIIEQNGQTYSTLFSYCDPTKLTSNQLSKIIDLVSLDSLPQHIMIFLKQRFAQEVDVQNDYPKAISNEANGDDSIEFFSINDTRPVIDNEEQQFLSTGSQSFKFFPSYDEDWVFRGIFHYIRTSYSKHILNKYVHLSCGGDKQEYLEPLFYYDDIQSLHWDNYSKSEPKLDFRNAWIMISLPSHKIKLTDYTLVASEKLASRPKLWTLYGKNHDDQEWQIIDNAENVAPNSGFSKRLCLTFRTYPKSYFSQFKFQFHENIGSRKGGAKQEISLCGIEFYGTFARQ
ncbi:hypothetical protein M9Y10_009478 [Tritrichomonas musculus]|uniref:BTB domain-containing protein n=1 Tax=Tritrichomonas musculus TaxID=1915356 RepID=A0ABR2IPU6_9EUKA